LLVFSPSVISWQLHKQAKPDVTGQQTTIAITLIIVHGQFQNPAKNEKQQPSFAVLILQSGII